MSGVELPVAPKPLAAAKESGRPTRAVVVVSSSSSSSVVVVVVAVVVVVSPVASRESGAALHVELAPNVSLSIELSSDISISLADVAAIRAAAAPLIAELARRQLALHAGEGDAE